MRLNKRQLITVIVILIFTGLLLIRVYDNHKKYELKNYYQQKMCRLLGTIQVDIIDAIEGNNRREVRNSALEYEQLGTIYADLSSLLFGSYLDSGNWGTCTNIMLGYNSCQMFQKFDGTLMENEVDFLQRLSEENKKLLKEISRETESGEIKDIRIEELEKILKNYHQTDLKEFLDDWK